MYLETLIYIVSKIVSTSNSLSYYIYQSPSIWLNSMLNIVANIGTTVNYWRHRCLRTNYDTLYVLGFQWHNYSEYWRSIISKFYTACTWLQNQPASCSNQIVAVQGKKWKMCIPDVYIIWPHNQATFLRYDYCFGNPFSKTMQILWISYGIRLR